MKKASAEAACIDMILDQFIKISLMKPTVSVPAVQVTWTKIMSKNKKVHDESNHQCRVMLPPLSARIPPPQ